MGRQWGKSCNPASRADSNVHSSIVRLCRASSLAWRKSDCVSPMRRLLTLVALLVIAPSVRAQTTASQKYDEAAPTFHASVNIVLVDAAVLNKKTHRAISPLMPKDFVVY